MGHGLFFHLVRFFFFPSSTAGHFGACVWGTLDLGDATTRVASPTAVTGPPGASPVNFFYFFFEIVIKNKLGLDRKL
jgi:hypothetical protein